MRRELLRNSTNAKGEVIIFSKIDVYLTCGQNGINDNILFYVVDELNKDIILGCDAVKKLDIDLNKCFKDYLSSINRTKLLNYNLKINNQPDIKINKDPNEILACISIGDKQKIEDKDIFKRLCKNYIDLWREKEKIF